MAGEIWHSFDSAETLYALIYRQADGYIWDRVAGAFESATWDNTNLLTYDITNNLGMSKSGDFHYFDFPTAIEAGTYYVTIRWRAGASPDTDDLIVAQGVMYWGGSTTSGGIGEEVDLIVIEENQDLQPNVFDERTAISKEELKL